MDKYYHAPYRACGSFIKEASKRAMTGFDLAQPGFFAAYTSYIKNIFEEDGLRVSNVDVWYEWETKTIRWQCDVAQQKELRVKADCYCQQYLNEIVSHYRSGVIAKELFKGDVVKFKHIYMNCYGNYICVVKDNKEYYLLDSDIEVIS